MTHEQQEEHPQYGNGKGDWTWRVFGVVVLAGSILWAGYGLNETINSRFNQVIAELQKVNETVVYHGARLDEHERVLERQEVRVSKLEDKR